MPSPKLKPNDKIYVELGMRVDEAERLQLVISHRLAKIKQAFSKIKRGKLQSFVFGDTLCESVLSLDDAVMECGCYEDLVQLHEALRIALRQPKAKKYRPISKTLFHKNWMLPNSENFFSVFQNWLVDTLVQCEGLCKDYDDLDDVSPLIAELAQLTGVAYELIYRRWRFKNKFYSKVVDVVEAVCADFRKSPQQWIDRDFKLSRLRRSKTRPDFRSLLDSQAAAGAWPHLDNFLDNLGDEDDEC